MMIHDKEPTPSQALYGLFNAAVGSIGGERERTPLGGFAPDAKSPNTVREKCATARARRPPR